MQPARAPKLLASALLIAAALPACCLFPRGDPHTPIPGPEDPRVLEDLEGVLVVLDRRRGRPAQAWDLAELAPIACDLPDDTVAASPPSANGLVAVVRQRRGEHRVQLMKLDGTEASEQLSTSPGDVSINTAVDVSPDGEHLAWLHSATQRAFQFSPWRILVLAADGGRIASLEAGFSLSGPRWSPDGGRLFFERDGEVIVWERAGGEEQSLGPGSSPIPMGECELFVQEAPGEGALRCLAGLHTDREVTLPGQLYSVVGPAGPRTLLYNAVPTEGDPQEPLPRGLMAPGWSWTIKAVDLRTGAFATVLRDVSDSAAVVGPAARQRMPRD